MSCLSCASENQTEFRVEMIIHPTGLKNLDNPGVWLYPKFFVCLDCGFAGITIPETELLLLAAPTPPTKRRGMAAD
jgi:hypothetical protein